MGQYFRSLWDALCGRVCVELQQTQAELQRARREHKETEAQVHLLKKLYEDCLRGTEKLTRELDTLQTLVENLRERVKEKDMLLEQLRQEYKNK